MHSDVIHVFMYKIMVANLFISPNIQYTMDFVILSYYKIDYH